MVNSKKILGVVMATILCFSVLCFAGCGKKESPQISPSDSNSTVSKSDTIVGGVTSESDKPTDLDSNISTDPFSYQISIDGNVIQLPCTVEKFSAIGWELEANVADNTLDEYYTDSVILYNGKEYFVANICNKGENPIKYSEAIIDDLIISDFGIKTHKIAVCNNLALGSTKDDVIAVYGSEADYEYKSDDDFDYSVLRYEGENFMHSVGFTFVNDVVTDISIRTD